MKTRSFVHKGLKRYYEENIVKGVPPDTVDKVRKMLAFIEAMQEAEELRCRIARSTTPLRSWLRSPFRAARASKRFFANGLVIR